MIYIASPFFNETERKVYRQIINIIRRTFPNEQLYIPADHEIPNAWEMPNAEWGKAVFEADVKAIDMSDTVVVINWGMYSDSGTAWEQGYAYAKGKKVYCVCVGDQKEVSLMMANGCSVLFNIRDREVK